jgi:aspartyl-tRNA(Asn)/glutamyl-tRNA(Gln) amidotransferase subunit C
MSPSGGRLRAAAMRIGGTALVAKPSLIPGWYITRSMAQVTPETVDHVAALARLSLTDEERSTFARQLDEILAYADAIQKLEVDAPPMSHAGTVARFREDVPSPSLSHERALSAAPDAADRLFRVPKVLAT